MQLVDVDGSHIVFIDKEQLLISLIPALVFGLKQLILTKKGW